MATANDVVVGAKIKAGDRTATVIALLDDKEAQIEWDHNGRIDQHSRLVLASYLVEPELPEIHMPSIVELLSK